MKIESNSTVKIHFELRLKDGSIAEDTRQIGQPMQFTMGDEAFSDKMEEELLGLAVGERKKIMLLPADAFGDTHPANIYEFPKSRFTGLDEPLEEGLIIAFTQQNGVELPGTVRAVSDTEVTIDFNHPLAVHVVLFDVEIVEIVEISA